MRFQIEELKPLHNDRPRAQTGIESRIGRPRVADGEGRAHGPPPLPLALNIPNIQRAQKLDPFSAAINMTPGMVLLLAGAQ